MIRRALFGLAAALFVGAAQAQIVLPGGGGSGGSYLPLSGGTVTGPITLSNGGPITLQYPGNTSNFTIQSAADTTQPGAAGAHFYQGDEALDIAKGLTYNPCVGAWVSDDPTYSQILYELGQTASRRWIGYSGVIPGPATISNASPAVVTLNSHGLTAGTKVCFTTTGTLPSPLAINTVYYVLAAGLGANSFEISLTNAGAAIVTTTNGSGTHTLVSGAKLFQYETVTASGTNISWYILAPTLFQLQPGQSTLTSWGDTAGNTWGNVDSSGRFHWQGAGTGGLSGTKDFNISGSFGLTPPVNTAAITASGYSLTGTNATSFIDLAGTWNTSGTPSAIKLNITNTASNSASLLMDLQVGGTSRVKIDAATGALAVNSPPHNNGMAFEAVTLGAATGGFYSASALNNVAYMLYSAGSYYGSIANIGTGLWALGSANSPTAIHSTALTWDANNNVVQNSAAVATNATDGFLYIASGAGTPTGTPTTFTGRVPLYYDTTNHQFWIYDGGWKQPKTPAGAALVTWQ